MTAGRTPGPAGRRRAPGADALRRGSLIVTIHALLLCARPISLSVAARSRPRGVRARRSHRAPVAAARAAGRSRARREPSATRAERARDQERSRELTVHSLQQIDSLKQIDDVNAMLLCDGGLVVTGHLVG